MGTGKIILACSMFTLIGFTLGSTAMHYAQRGDCHRETEALRAELATQLKSIDARTAEALKLARDNKAAAQSNAEAITQIKIQSAPRPQKPPPR